MTLSICLISHSPTHTLRPVIKVLHITTDFIPGTGGLERFIRDLAIHSRDAGLAPSILALNKIAGDARTLPPHEIIDGLTVHRVPFLDLRYYKPTTLPIALLKKADVLHVHGLGAPLDYVAASKWLHRRPIVMSTHGGIFHNAALSSIKDAYFQVIRSLVFPRVDQIVACGQADRHLFVDHGVTKLITIDNGIDLQPFANSARPRRIPGRVLFAGRIAPNKAVDRLVFAVAEARKLGADVSLRVIGPDRYRLISGLRHLSADLGLASHAAFAGEVSDEQLPLEYLSADLFVSASRHEGFGISAVEAMAAGAVPLLNDISAFRYLLKSPDGKTAGQIVNFTDSVASGNAISQLIASDRSALRAAAKNRAAHFSWQRLIPQWKALYESLCSG